MRRDVSTLDWVQRAGGGMAFVPFRRVVRTARLARTYEPSGAYGGSVAEHRLDCGHTVYFPWSRRRTVGSHCRECWQSTESPDTGRRSARAAAPTRPGAPIQTGSIP